MLFDSRLFMRVVCMRKNQEIPHKYGAAPQLTAIGWKMMQSGRDKGITLSMRP